MTEEVVELVVTAYTKMFPEGLTTKLPVNVLLIDIYSLLRNGRNVKVILEKDDGSRAEYQLPKEDR
jgi:hypothetical protein